MRFLSVLALPLVAAMPSYSEGALQRARSALSAGLEVERRGAMMSNAAMAQFEFAPYEITYLAVQCRKGGKEAPKTGLYNCTLSFDWFDPNSVRQNNVSSTACSSSWLWDYQRAGREQHVQHRRQAVWAPGFYDVVCELRERDRLRGRTGAPVQG
jgi:hypothetical protein